MLAAAASKRPPKGCGSQSRWSLRIRSTAPCGTTTSATRTSAAAASGSLTARPLSSGTSPRPPTASSKRASACAVADGLPRPRRRGKGRAGSGDNSSRGAALPSTSGERASAPTAAHSSSVLLQSIAAPEAPGEGAGVAAASPQSSLPEVDAAATASPQSSSEDEALAEPWLGDIWIVETAWKGFAQDLWKVGKVGNMGALVVKGGQGWSDVSRSGRGCAGVNLS